MTDQTPPGLSEAIEHFTKLIRYHEDPCIKRVEYSVESNKTVERIKLILQRLDYLEHTLVVQRSNATL